MENKEQVKEKFVSRAPDYKGDGVAVWVNQSKEKKPYLTIKILGKLSVTAFKQEPKVVEEAVL